MKIRKIVIPDVDLLDGHTVYFIEVSIKEYAWTIRKRYREFYELHEKLVKNHGVQGNLLPPKKYFGNLEAYHVEKRRQALEGYLELLIEKFDENLPNELNIFLEGHKYDICGVTYSLAQELFNKGDEILSKEDPYVLTPLQLYCITKRLELPVPTCDAQVHHGEIGNLYDFIQNLKHLKIGASATQDELYRFSENVIFKCDLALFKSLLSLEISGCEVEPFQGICRLQNKLQSLVVHHSIHLLKDILVDDEMWEQGILESVDVDGTAQLSPTTNYRTWGMLTSADFSNNELPYIDDSVALLPNVEKFNLSNNHIESIEHLQGLSKLVDLDLSNNDIQCLEENLNAKLGNIKRLNLSTNQLSNVDGLEKLFSLEELDLSSNKLCEVASVVLLGQLPCLEVLLLMGNPIAKESMYRARVLSAFDERAQEVALDHQKATRREMKKINELLSEEQSFEIIDLPRDAAGSTQSKTKAGNKKMKSLGRVISLDGSSSKELSDSTSGVDDSDQEFRSRVEEIRQLGGDTWLTMLGEIQNEDKTSSKNRMKIPHDTELQPRSKGTNISSYRHGNGYPEDETGGSPSSEGERSFKSSSSTFIAKVAGVEPGETGTGPPRLHFGFTCELEELVRNKLGTDTNTTSGTYMVEVQTNVEESSTAEDDKVYEERMVGLDLSKGVILEIQIANGKTCAKHKLDEVSSVDILEIQDCYHIDIRDTYSKEWRRHRSTAQQNDYRQVARYRMRSMADAAELFVLLYKFITKSYESPVIQNQASKTSASSSQSTPSSNIWANPFGLQEEALQAFFTSFLRRGASKQSSITSDHSYHDGKDRVRGSGIHGIYHSLRADFMDAGTLKHERSRVDEESARLALWVGCLPYLFPEHELPVCLVLTNFNIFLFHIIQSGCQVKDLHQVLHCFYSMPIHALKHVVIGLYDQGFRLEVRNDSSRGTFTFLTRDSEKTRVFLETLHEMLGESREDENSLLNSRVSFESKSSTLPSFSYPDEQNLSMLKESLSGAVQDDSVKEEDLLMYSIVREFPESILSNQHEDGILTKRLRSLIVMNSKIFLCDEDHVHWPLPTFVRAPPSTPQWVVSRWQEINKIIGIDVFDLENASEFVGSFGLSLIFDDEDLVSEEVESMASTQARGSICWNMIFRAVDEREQLLRSLAQVWKDQFEADLNVTHSKPRSLITPPGEDSTDLSGFQDPTAKPNTPVGTPAEASFKKSHRRVGSDNLPLFKASTLDCLESLMTLDRKTLDKYFNKLIAQKPEGEDEKLLHVLWTGCTPYLFPDKEVQVCVLLSNLFIYILADRGGKELISKKKTVKLGPSHKDSTKCICYNYIPTATLHQICVGLFDQTVRVEGKNKEETFTFITRDFNLTNAFLECLNAVLSSNHSESSSTSKQDNNTSSTASIYDRQISDQTGEMWHKPESLLLEKGVKFVYPSDDSLEILKDTIAKFSQESDLCSSIFDVTILVYLLVFHETSAGVEEPRTLIIMDQSLCLCIEDHVHYPLTLFTTGLPDIPQYKIWDVRDVETLSRIEFTDFNSCDFTLVFSPSAPECEKNSDDFESASMGELCVITHYTPEEISETTWKIIAPTYEEKEKSLSLICRLWSDIRGEALPVMKGRDKNTS